MIEGVGVIVELKSNAVAAVLCQKSTLCEHCVSAGLCSMGDDGRSTLVDAHNSLGAELGDSVRVVTSTRNFLQSSFILYIVPLIALIVGAAVGELVGRHAAVGMDPDLFAALSGTACLIGSLLLIRVGSRSLPRATYMPHITAIIGEE
jgi:sigma-E factor negative regulatory protein RseC